MKGKILVSGSIAYDFIMQYEGFFHKAILKEHLKHLNIAFIAKNKKMHFGGCGGNIAYSLALLGMEPLLYGVAGKDFGEYEKWLSKNNINDKYVGKDPDEFTATAYVLTDKKENQVTMFSPGAMESFKYEKKLTKKDLEDVNLAILSPDVCERTFRLANILIKAGIPYIFDPGQLTHEFKLSDLKFLLKNAYGFISNHYELKLICEHLKISPKDISKNVEIFIETLGEKGSVLRHKNKTYRIKTVKPEKILDPTGCGDAFRAGVLFGLNKGYDPAMACEIGSLLATYSIEKIGTQSHRFTLSEFLKRLK